MNMEVNKLSDFTEQLAKLKLDNAKQLFFRGHSSKNYELKPTLYRPERYHLSEDKIFKDIIMTCPQDFTTAKSTMEILVKMQHYGVPTRILDLTRNALVALYFSCVSRLDKDGEVILLQIPNNDVCYFDSDKVSILANLAKQKNDFIFDYHPSFSYKNRNDVEYVNNEYFGYLLHSIKEEKPHFKDIIDPKDIEKVFAVQAKLDNPRIIRQGGAFLLFGCKKDKSIASDVDSKWIIKPKGEKIIIPKDSKEKLLKELDILGINSSTLFPELDDQAEFIKERYNKKII